MVWNGINKSIINIKSKNYDSFNSIEINNQIQTEPVNIANSFNEYFTTIADKIVSKRKYNGNKSYRDFLANHLLENFIFADCDEDEIETIIMSFKLGKSVGPNSIPIKLLKYLGKSTCKPIKEIFNLSLRSGIHPDILKIAKTVPIYKKGSRLLVSNYRPISLLSNLNKILEKLVHKRTYSFMEEKKILYTKQFGFRKGHSTNHALIDITETIRKALDDGKFAGGVFVDLQKAFDTVNHDILIDKLSYYGIHGRTQDWFRTYLKNRTQFVSIVGHSSKTERICHGVPQGSVLGPLLFLIYINDLFSSIKYSTVFHFADDTNLLNISDNFKQLQKRMNKDLKILHPYMAACE